MNSQTLDKQVSISGQITLDDIPTLAQSGVEILVCNRPDGEAADQTPFAKIAAAAENAGMQVANIPFVGGFLTEQQAQEFAAVLTTGKRVHAYCRTGNRCNIIYNAAREMMQQNTSAEADSSAAQPIANPDKSAKKPEATPNYDVVIVGGGSGGIACASSLLNREPKSRIAIIEPSTDHFYQPGWTMVGGGVFDASTTHRTTASVMPSEVHWIQQRAVKIDPQNNHVQLADGTQVRYGHLVVATGLVLNWAGVEGLEETLGKNGVTSNYRYDLAPYTWQLVQGLKKGRAVFTQPPMPIKCAGAPQKALYLSCSGWRKNGVLSDIDVQFYNAGGVLFGVSDYVPALQSYIDRYNAKVNFMHNLVKVDGNTKTAWFVRTTDAGKETVETNFDMLHVCPPQNAPAIIRESGLADNAGWLDVDANTLRHNKYSNIWGVGDVLGTTNAKTMAAARQQAPVVAQNLANALRGLAPSSSYYGYGSCPLTVEHGKIVLAEFSYGGKVTPTFPDWINNGRRPTRFAWLLKAKILPQLYWHGMLKGREWLAKPVKVA